MDSADELTGEYPQMIMRIAVLALALASQANAQYAASASGSTTAAAEINGKMNHQEYAGSPDGVLSCTVGKDWATDTTTGDLWKCKTTGTVWMRVSEGGYVTYTSNQTGLGADSGKWVKMNGSSITYTLPSPPPVNWHVVLQNVAASDLTISRNSMTINGGTTNLTLKQYSVVSIYTDGTNYMASVPLVAGANITLTPGVAGLTVAATGGSGSGCIPSGSSGQLLTDNGAGACTSNSVLPTAMEPAHTGDVTNSAGSVNLIIAANAVTSAKMAAVNARRTCVIDNDTQSATALTSAQITGRCEIPFAAHIIEVAVWGGTGTGTQTYTGSSSVQLTRYRPNGATTATILSAALATPNTSTNGNHMCALPATSGTCIDGVTSSSSITLAGGITIALSAGDLLYVSSATADTTQTWFTIIITYTID